MTHSKNAVFSFLHHHWSILLPPLLVCLICLFSPLFLPAICAVGWPYLWLGLTIVATVITFGICQLINMAMCDARQKKIAKEVGNIDLDESVSEQELSKVISLDELIKTSETKNVAPTKKDARALQQGEAKTKQALNQMKKVHALYYQHLVAHCLNPTGVTLIEKNVHWRVYGEWYGLLNEDEELKPGVIELVKEKQREAYLPVHPKTLPDDDILSDDNQITFPSLQF